jgi:hypothetical protein
VITRDDSQVKHLPKIAWILLVVFLPLVGSIVWFAAGREWGAVERSHGRYTDPIAVTRPAPTPSVSDTERQLAELDAEIEFYENQQRIAALQAEVEERRKAEG